jgi:D-alanine transaminase
VSRFVYVNGRYVPYGAARVHVEDRGFQFADAIYEVIEVKDGRMVDEARHLARLARSLGELVIPAPMSAPALAHVLRETIRRNRVRDGSVYLQISRGRGPRDFQWPEHGLDPTIVCIARRVDREKLARLAETGIAVITVPDNRWRRSDIKTVMLLPAVLAKEQARQAGARDAWFVDSDGFVTEGASANAWIVEAGRRLVTRPLDRSILPGVTRATLIGLLAREGLELVERPFRVSEAHSAAEAFNTSATGTVMPVVVIDGKPVGSGRPGPVAARLRALFHQVAERSTA